MITKAMILAAGFGKRMRPLTHNLPKPLLKIRNKTLLANTINFLKNFGIKEIVINVHYLGEQIVDYINKNNFNISIKIIIEKNKIRDTGGGRLNTINYFSHEPFLVINPDTIWSLNYLEELKLMENDFFSNEKNKCSLLVVDKSKSFDINLKGDFNLENNFINKKNLKYIYTGLQIIRPEIFNNITDHVFSVSKIWDNLIDKKELRGTESKIDFLHVSTLSIYKSLIKNI